MPKTQLAYTSFTSGEISPLLTERVDFAKYFSGLEKLENFIIYPQGGVTRRSGTVFVAEAKYHDRATRLISFAFSVTETYLLEFGDYYIRFYKDKAQLVSGGSPYEISSPYAANDLAALQYAQNADVIYIAHSSYPIYKLSRAGDTSWTIAEVEFEPMPTYEADTDMNADLTPAATTGEGIDFTSTSDIFLNGDVGRLIVAGAARGVIVSRTTGFVVVVDIIDDWPDTSTMAAGTWYITGTPVVQVTPSAKTPVGKRITVTAGTGDGWARSGMVGKYMKINGGLLKIRKIVSNLEVKADIMGILDNTNVAPGGTWTVEVPAWSSSRGYPGAVCFYQQRLFFAGAPLQPSTVWGSRTGSYEDFSVGTKDDDAVDYELTSQEKIIWMSPTRDINIGAGGQEMVLGTGDFADALTPTNVMATYETTYGSAEISPLKIGHAIVFVQRAGRKLREFAFIAERDPRKAVDLTVLAEHITQGGINSLAFQQEPHGLIYVTRADGQMPTMTYLREHEITGWARFTTVGRFADVAVVPYSDGDRVWVLAQRDILGQQKQYIEYFSEDLWAGINLFQWDMANTDSAIKYVGASTVTVAGLGHLEGKTVAVLVNGAVHPDKVVIGGQITLERMGTEIEVGLPYTASGITVRPRLDTAAGTIQGRIRGWGEITARLYKSLGGKINDETVETRTTADLMDKSPPLFSGDFRVYNLGYDLQGRIFFEQSQPLPWILLSLSGVLDIG